MLVEKVQDNGTYAICPKCKKRVSTRKEQKKYKIDVFCVGCGYRMAVKFVKERILKEIPEIYELKAK